MSTRDARAAIRKRAHKEIKRLLGQICGRIDELHDDELAYLLQQLRDELAKEYIISEVNGNGDLGPQE